MIQIFSEELEKGSGVPYLLIRKGLINASAETDSILLDNIVNNRAFDPQCEGSRAEYLFALVEIYGNREFIYKEILKRFHEMVGEDYGELQIFDFVLEMAKADLVDKKILYDKISFYVNDRKDDSFSGMQSLLEWDGPEAAFFLARELGKLISTAPDREWNYYSFYYDQENKESIIEELNKSDDIYVKLYLEKYKNEKGYSCTKSRRKSVEEILAFSEDKRFIPLRPWLKKSTGEERKKIAEYFLSCADIKKRTQILLAFDGVKIPLEYGFLKNELLKAEDRDYQISIARALLLFGEPEVKSLIFDIYSDDSPVLYLQTLALFYEDEDQDLLMDKIDELNIYTCHAVLDDLIDSKKLQKNPGVYKKVLNKLYNRNKCSLCRKLIFEKMVSFDMLDVTICEEGMFDCNRELSSMAKKIFADRFEMRMAK